MKNIFVEGIQGSGKSTLINNIVKFNPELHVCREGDYSPIELAWCALMSKKENEDVLEKYNSIRDEIIKNTVREQENYIITYTKIITDIPGFYKDLANYEVYNGRKTLAELKEIIVTRFKNFTDTGYLFECSFFQNVIEDLILFHMLSDEEIIEFYRNLFRCIDAKKFILFYLYSDKLEENIKIIQKERCDENGNELWYQMMLEYLVNSPYGRKHECSAFEDMISHFKHRQELELRIVKEIIGKNAVILPAKEYDVNQIRTLIGFHNKISYNIRHMNLGDGVRGSLLDTNNCKGNIMSKRWSKLQSRLYNLMDPKADFQIHVALYEMNSNDGYHGYKLPRYFITIGKEIVFQKKRRTIMGKMIWNMKIIFW